MDSFAGSNAATADVVVVPATGDFANFSLPAARPPLQVTRHG